MSLFIDWPGLLFAAGNPSVTALAERTGLPYHVVYRIVRGNVVHLNLEAAGRLLLVLNARLSPPFFIQWQHDNEENSGDNC